MRKDTIGKPGLGKAWLWLLAAWLLMPADLSAQVLDNNKLRFGTGFEASINQDGNLQQPFYYNAVKRAWRKLTFYAYPLETAIGVGGDKTSEWNTNGTIVQHPALSGQVLDTSGFVVSNLTNGRGSGTIVSKGTIQIGGHLLGVENTYTLPANSAYIKITTRIKNQGAGLAENVRMWIGTRDDWVGTTDVPVKQKGDLVNGQFVPATSGASRTSALQISSKEEGVFFYTDSPKANTIIQDCCNFSNIINQDPQASPIDLSGDASYGFFVRLQDLQPGDSEFFTWYYAAGEVSLMPEILVDVAAAIGGIRNISYTTATLQATATAAATGYWLVVPRNAAEPTAAQVIAGISYGPVVAASGSAPMGPQEPRDFAISGLGPGTPYKLYFVAEEAGGGLSAVRQVPFTTQALSLPSLNTLAPTSITATGALAGGQVDNDGGASVTARGLCWSTSGSPTLANSKTTDGTGTGAFTSTMHQLVPNTTYYVRAYATNSQGTAYGKTLYFKTSPVAPSLALSANDICLGSTSKISATGVQGTLYWYADTCGGTPQGAGTSLTVSPTITTTYYARNYNGTYSTCSQVTVRVNNEPPAVAGKDITLNLRADRSASLSPADIDQGSRDTCGPVMLAITSGKTAFDCADLGQTYPVSLTATDQQGNTATVTVQVTVADGHSYCNQAPVAVTKPLTLAASADCLAAVAPEALDGGSTDADGDTLTFSCYPAGPYSIGTTPVTFTVTDPAGASSSATTTVTVVDDSAPVFAPQPATSVSNDPGVNGAVVHYTIPAASDNCGASTVQIAGLAPGSLFPVGTTTNTFRATDAAGQVAETSFTVTVTDTEAPQVAVKNIRVALSETGQAEIACYQVNNGSSDNCGIAGFTLDKTVFDCSNIGENKVVLTVTDVHGNVSRAIAIVTVEDKTEPVIVTRNISVQLDAQGMATLMPDQIDKGTYDACGVASFTLSKTAFSCSDVGPNNIEVKVMDVHGNESKAIVSVTVMDVTVPVAIARAGLILTLHDGQASLSAQQLDAGSTDACGIASVTVSPASFTCAHIGLNPVVLTVTDRSGNVSTATAMVQVAGAVPVSAIQVLQEHCGHPEHRNHPDHKRCGHKNHEEKEHHKSCRLHPILAGSSLDLDPNTLYLGYGQQSLVLDATGGEEEHASYFWSGNGTLSSKTSGMPVFTPKAAGVYTFTVVETNSFGCSASSSVTITVVDARCGNKNDKVSICHKGQQICVAPEAVPAHLAHGDQIGPCTNPATANARMAREVAYAQVLGLTAYPNPARERTTIEFSMLSAGSFRLALFDMKGALVRKIAAGQAEANQFFSFEFNVRALPAGVYLIRLGTDQQVATKKLVIEK